MSLTDWWWDLYWDVRRCLKPRVIRRAILYWWQRRTRGWSDKELWSLDWTFANWIVPRLERLREIAHGYPAGMTAEQWDRIMMEMIRGFRVMASEQDRDISPAEYQLVVRARQLFAEHLPNLPD